MLSVENCFLKFPFWFRQLNCQTGNFTPSISIVTLSQQLFEHLHSAAKTYISLCLYESQACCFLNSWHCIISCATFEGAYDLFVVRCTTLTLKCFTYVSFMNYSTFWISYLFRKQCWFFCVKLAVYLEIMTLETPFVFIAPAQWFCHSWAPLLKWPKSNYSSHFSSMAPQIGRLERWSRAFVDCLKLMFLP